MDPPATDISTQPFFWSSFDISPKRIQNGGWARELTSEDFAIFEEIARRLHAFGQIVLDGPRIVAVIGELVNKDAPAIGSGVLDRNRPFYESVRFTASGMVLRRRYEQFVRLVEAAQFMRSQRSQCAAMRARKIVDSDPPALPLPQKCGDGR